MTSLSRLLIGVAATLITVSSGLAATGGSLPLRMVVNEVEQPESVDDASGYRRIYAEPERLAAAVEAQERHTDALMREAKARGTAVGWDANDEPVIKVYVDESTSLPAIPAALDGVPVEIEYTGRVYALNVGCEDRDDKCGEQPVKATPQIIEPIAGNPGPTQYHPRPVPIGVSAGHIDVTAGTIGCRVSAGCHTYALSNAHVFADENSGVIGDNVLQPGVVDGGISPDDAIGTLADSVPIVFSQFAFNRVDAAIVLTTPDYLGTATHIDGYGEPRTNPMNATVGLNVQKFGRTTWQTHGYVDAVNATVLVAYEGGDARFVGQIIIKANSGDFSRAGDSGALVVADGGPHDRRPVALLFASGVGISVANPIDEVLDELGVVIDGE